MVVAILGLNFLLDLATPKLFKLLSVCGVLGIILYFFLGSGGGRGGSLGGEAPPIRDAP